MEAGTRDRFGTLSERELAQGIEISIIGIAQAFDERVYLRSATGLYYLLDLPHRLSWPFGCPVRLSGTWLGAFRVRVKSMSRLGALVSDQLQASLERWLLTVSLSQLVSNEQIMPLLSQTPMPQPSTELHLPHSVLLFYRAS